MIKVKEIVPDPNYNPTKPLNWGGNPGPINRPNMWQYKDAERNLQPGNGGITINLSSKEG